MKTQIHSRLKTNIAAMLLGTCLVLAATAQAGDPRTNSWLTTYSGQYARIYTNAAMQAAGTPLTTWSNGSQTQSLPTYDGVQDVYSSADWVYVRSTGLASYNMGPWYMTSAHTSEFVNLPVNQKNLYHIPRTNSVPTTKTENGGGQIGIFVDGVAMFNSWDAYTWDPATSSDAQNYTGYWNRDAYVNEGATFDPGYAHQQNTGVYHYHADPIGLRYLMGDHVDYNSTSKTYSEDTNAPTQHSPILGWVADGFPIYGPYGYSNSTNSSSGIRRMVSGYVPRNGLNGTDNLSTNGAARSTIPVWAQVLYKVSASQSGPTVSTNADSYYPFGRYMEDNAYLGDLTNAATGSNYQQGVDFDLDQYNGRFCVTPDFPGGTYAYFVAIDSNGVPVFPYNIGRAYYGSPAGGAVTNIAETVATNFLGGPDAAPLLHAPAVNNGAVILTWSATEGGTYLVQSTTNFSAWTTNSTSVAAVLNGASFTDNPTDSYRFYRVAQTALAPYDPVTGTSTGGGGGQTITLLPNSGTAGTSFSVSATISSGATPAPPIHSGAQVTTFSIGANNVAGANYTYNANGSGTVTGTVNSLAGTGSQTVTITFAPPPGQMQGPTYSQTAGFTINP